MQSSSIRRRLPQLTFVIAALMVGVFLSHGDSGNTQAVGTFDPDFETRLCNQFAGPGPFTAFDALCAEAPVGTGAVADVTTKLLITAGDYNFSMVVTTVPGAATIAEGPGFAGHGAADPQLGDVTGRLVSSSSLGLINGACATPTPVPFIFINATVDNSAGNMWDAQLAASAGTEGSLETMHYDDGTAPTAIAQGDPATDGRDNDNDGAADEADENMVADGLPVRVDHYPSYLNALFDPDWVSYGADLEPYNGDDVNGATPPVQPIQRHTGGAVVSGSAVVLDLLVFAPGALAAAYAAPHPFSDLDASMGYTTVTVLQNPTATAAPSGITDFCSEVISLTTLFGEARTNECNGDPVACNLRGEINDPTTQGPLVSNGLDRYLTPAAAGNYMYVGYAQSLRDADDDGYENGLDTCPYAVNTENPHTGPGPDADMLDSVCDATPGANTGANNHDGDVASNGGAWLNAGDNCPQAANGDQLETELNLSYSNPFATNPAPQGGPKTDAIGDACDTDDDTADGTYLAKLGSTSPPTAKCHGGVDADGDGWCTAAGGGVAAFDPNDANASIIPEDYDMVFTVATAHASAGATPLSRMPIQVCNDGVDNDGDGMIDNLDAGAGNSTCRPVSVSTTDSDGDGASDEAERHVGTNPLGRCGVGAVPAQSNAWPIDFVSGGIPLSTDRVVITDLTSFLAPARRLDTFPGHANFDVRWDIQPGTAIGSNWINISDLTTLFAGSTGFPPMSGGAKVFGTGFTCSAHATFGD